MPIDVAALRAQADGGAHAAAALESAIDARLAAGRCRARRVRAERPARPAWSSCLPTTTARADTKWYRHVFYGWNIYSLYDGQPFPGLAEALRVKDAARIAHEVSASSARSIA